MEAFLQGESVKSVGVAAMLLALTRTLKDEETAKRALTEVGHKFVVTEVGGKTSYDDFHEKVNRALWNIMRLLLPISASLTVLMCMVILIILCAMRLISVRIIRFLIIRISLMRF